MSQKFKSDIEAQAGIRDSSGAIGTSGQVLSSTGSNVSWINQTTIANDVQNLVKAGVAINKGQAVYVTGADGTNIIVGLASNTSEATSSKTLGLLNANVSINGMADVVQIGRLSGLNTIGATAGDPVWLGTNGNLIYGLANKPYAPAHLVFIGIVTRVNANNGEMFINVQNGFELNEIHDVDLKTNVPINGDVLGFNGTLWVNKTIAQWLGYTPANASGTTNYVSKFTGATSLGNSQIFDNGTNVGIGTSNPINYTNKTNLAIQGTWGGQLDIMAGSTSHAQFGSDNYDSGLSARIQSADGIVFKTNGGTEKMRITSGGNVGIGTTSPSEKFQIGNNFKVSNDGVTTWGVTNGNGILSWDSNLAIIGGLANTNVQFRANNAEVMRLTTSGNVGIGTPSPAFKLDILSSNPRLRIADTSTGSVIIDMQGGIGSFYIGSDNSTGSAFGGSPYAATLYRSGNYPISMWTNNSEKFRINGNGNVGIGTTAPIHKLSVNGKIGGDVYADSFVEFTATTETIVSADGNVVLGYAQNVVVDNEGSVGVGTIAPESCAALEVKSLSQGFLPPRMRTGDRDGITNPVPGLMIFNEDTETIDVFTSLLGWRSLLF